MTESFDERWAALAVRAGKRLSDLFQAVEDAMARDGYLTADQVLSLVEQALDRIEREQGYPPSE